MFLLKRLNYYKELLFIARPRICELPSFFHVGPVWALCGPYVGPMWALCGPCKGVKYSLYGGRVLNICPLLVLPRSTSPSPRPAQAGSPANLLRQGTLLLNL